MNEEEIKVRYVLPWLKQCGVDLHELQLERTFSVKLGRHTLSTGATATSENASGRLDILVRRGKKNLLIVETKAGGLLLTDGDRDQAISYARLVHPIAPYAVVTNGTEYRLYDSVTKKEIAPNQIRVDGLQIALPDEDIAEAQRLFLTPTRSNLMEFCRLQVEGELLPLKGTLDDGRKYVPSIHVPRSAVDDALKQFFVSPHDQPGLLLLGESGSGKTCELCGIAERLCAIGLPVLFFSGPALESDILSAVAKEFSWTFNGADVPVQTIKRLAALAGTSPLTIIVDAIDEWSYSSPGNHLGSLLQAAQNRNIKVIASCKASAAGQFLKVRDTPTAVSLLMKEFPIGHLSPKEFFAAVGKYRDAYEFRGGFENAVLDEARSNPFLLRVLFDVAQKSNAEHLTFSSAEFFETYYRKSIAKTSNAGQAERTLIAIVKLLFERNVDWVEEAEVRAELGLGINESIMEDLFEYAILQRSHDQGTGPMIGFYFQQLRDYLIAFEALKFHRMPPESVAKVFDEVSFPSMRGDVLNLYYRLAPPQHKRVFDGDLRQRATQYLRNYTALIEQHFPALRSRLRPETERPIGFIAELMLGRRSLGGYGFRPIGETDEEVHFIPVNQMLDKSNLASLNGGDYLHFASSSMGFQDGINVGQEVIEHELIDQFHLLVKEGRLNESKTPDLLSEQLVEVVACQKEIFGRLHAPGHQGVQFPLRLDEVTECLLREKLIRHYREELIDEKTKRGEGREHWNGDFVIRHLPHLTSDDITTIEMRATAALGSGRLPTFRARYLELDNLEDVVSPAVSGLRCRGNGLTGPVFGSRQHVARALLDGRPVPVEERAAYLADLFSAFLSNYKVLVETNFPTFASSFKLYSQLPVSLYLRIGESIDRGYRAYTTLEKYYVRSDTDASTVEVIDHGDASQSSDYEHVAIRGTEYDLISWSSTTVENVFSSAPGLDYNRFRHMVLRTRVYSQLMSEFPEVEQAMRRFLSPKERADTLLRQQPRV